MILTLNSMKNNWCLLTGLSDPAAEWLNGCDIYSALAAVVLG